MQRLTNVDVAEARDHTLVQQRRFQAGLFAATGARQHGGVKRIAERLGTEIFEKRLGIELVAGR